MSSRGKGLTFLLLGCIAVGLCLHLVPLKKSADAPRRSLSELQAELDQLRVRQTYPVKRAYVPGASASEADGESRDESIARQKKKILAAHRSSITPEEKASLTERGILFNITRSRWACVRDPYVLHMRNGLLDARVVAEGGPGLAIPKGFEAAVGGKRHIVMFEGDSQNMRKTLETAGAHVEHFLPSRAWAVSADAEAMAQVRALDNVIHTEPYHPYFKMDASVQSYLLGPGRAEVAEVVESGRYKVLFFNAAGAEALRKLGATVRVRESAGMTIGDVDCDVGLLDDVVRSEAVKWVQTRMQPKACNDLANERMRSRPLKIRYPGLNGSNVTVAVTDTGVDDTHPGFSIDVTQPTDYMGSNGNSRIVYYGIGTNLNFSYSDGVVGDDDGHGTHVSGSILGNGGDSITVSNAPGSGKPYATNEFEGIAPAANLVFLEDFIAFSNDEMAEEAWTHGARLLNASWGAAIPNYTIESAEWDGLVRDADSNIVGDQELAAFFAAGNDGDGDDNGGLAASPGSVGSPGNAKNVITVGAAEQPRRANNLLSQTMNSIEISDTDWQVAGYSSRGITPDGRIKPDIVAPGSYILSAQTKDQNFDVVEWGDWPDLDFRQGNVDTRARYAMFRGTSMATPLTTGAGALIYQWYQDTYSMTPSPAMLKALLISGAQTLNSTLYEMTLDGPGGGRTPLETVQQGWGMVNVMASVEGPQIRSTDNIILMDQIKAIAANGDVNLESYQVSGADEGGLKIVMVYTDSAGTPGAGLALVNDIDLSVTAPDGTVYHGNYMMRQVWGQASIEQDFYDILLVDGINNVETIIIRDAIPGTYEIKVEGFNVPQGPQDYALVITKGISSAGDSGGVMPALALGTNDRPVMATANRAGLDPTNTQVMGVRHWEGPFGDASEYGEWRHTRHQWFDYGTDVDAELISGFLDEWGLVFDPSVAVNLGNGNVYAAWTYQNFDSNFPHCIYFRQWDGNSWAALGGSYDNLGICDPDIAKNASNPKVGVAWDGNPLIAYIQPRLDMEELALYKEVIVKKWDGANWVGISFDGSGTVAERAFAKGLDMVMDSAGNPVVAWRDLTDSQDPRIRVFRWNGTTWAQVGANVGVFVGGTPSLAAVADTFYLAYRQYPDPSDISQFKTTARAAMSTGGGWTTMAGIQTDSMAYPGLSGTNESAYNVQVGAHAGSVCVGWTTSETNDNLVLMKRWDNTAWAGIDGSASNSIVALSGRVILTDVVVNSEGMPSIAVQNTSVDGMERSDVFSVVGVVPSRGFLGLISATPTTNQSVDLVWSPVTGSGVPIVYHIYMSPVGWPSASPPTPPPTAGEIAAAFGNEIATITSAGTFEVTLTNGMALDQVYYFGVRAEGPGTLPPLFDGNTVLRLAGPYSLALDADPDNDWLVTSNELIVGTRPDQPDTDGDGMGDGWEWWYSTNNPAHSNALAMDPLDNGTDNLRSTNDLTDGAAGQGPYDDLDGDGMLNIEEYAYWYSNWFGVAYTSTIASVSSNWWLDPTNPDTDGDGMGDGWEVLNGLDPGDGSDGGADTPDGDGVINSDEYIWGGSPQSDDTDNDGLTDLQEIALGTSAGLADTDGDGLPDGMDTGQWDPLMADTDLDGITDGEEYELGQNSGDAPTVDVNTILFEDFEGISWLFWTSTSPSVPLWHRTQVDPDPPQYTNTAPPPRPRYITDHSVTWMYRCANDPAANNIDATYDYPPGAFVYSAFTSPAFNPGVNGPVNRLYVSWREYHETEAEWDVCEVLATRDGGLNWSLIRSGVSGVTTGWVNRVADLSDFANDNPVQIRFLFRTKNDINNEFRGWWIDDIQVYATARISGFVRDLNGEPIENATVYAMGRGGRTNIVDGNAYVYPGTIFGKAVAWEDGSYTIDGLPQGEYYVKAWDPGYVAEFWNGQLWNWGGLQYFQAFGGEMSAGVPDRRQAEGSGVVNATALNSSRRCDFELEPGTARSYLGVTYAGTPLDIYINQDADPAQQWNGSTNPPALVTYTTTTAIAINTYPDWINNVVVPQLMGDLDEGDHTLYLHPSWSNMPYFPRVDLPIREGEVTLVDIRTNQVNGRIYIYCDSGIYPVWIDNRQTAVLTTGAAYPVVVDVKAGWHEIVLRDATNKWISPQQFLVPPSGRANAIFTTNDVAGPLGSIRVETEDINGNVITGAVVYVNGQLITAADVSGQPITPATVIDIVAGHHTVTAYKEGYRFGALESVNILSNAVTAVKISLAESDRDYDLVGDGAELAGLSGGLSNIFLGDRADDSDGDGLSNLLEYTLGRINRMTLDQNSADSDGDRMMDNEEVGFDGQTNWLAISRLFTNASVGGTTIRTYFSGRYLEGQNAFNMGNLPTNLWISVDGDLFRATSMTFSPGNFAEPIMDFGCLIAGPPDEVIDAGFNFNTRVFADPYPNTNDSDADIMWDGFEFMYLGVGDLNPIEYGAQNNDPDNDGLSNLDEFLGSDGLADSNNWVNPGTSDTDGDGMPDGWEIDHGLNPTDPVDANGDPDNDGLINLDEWQWLTDPFNPDSDNDNLIDGDEVNTYGSHPLQLDTDNDGLLDGEEVYDTDSNPVTGIDGGFFPNWNGGDLDNDGDIDGPTDWDTDGDGMPDGFEVKDTWGNIRPVAVRLDPYDPTDGDEDPDGDSLINRDEYLVRDALIGAHPGGFNAFFDYVVWDYTTDPFNPDSDGDGMPDGWEVWRGLHPRDPIPWVDPFAGTNNLFFRFSELGRYTDHDQDGVSAWNEYNIRFVIKSGADPYVMEGSTHPWERDTDRDGLEDGQEIKSFGSNPLNQDTDGDHVLDGGGIPGRLAEIDTFPVAGNPSQYDQSLSDMWTMDMPGGYPYPIWSQVAAHGTLPVPARWGGAMSSQAYSTPDNALGNYVGRPTLAGNSEVPGGQALLNCNAEIIIGGRDGVRQYNEVWMNDYSTTDGWVLRNTVMDGIGMLAADAECLAIGKTSTVNTPGYPTTRPRPGGPPEFEFYDGLNNNPPLEIWGAEGGINWDGTLVYWGWDSVKEYWPQDANGWPYVVPDFGTGPLSSSNTYHLVVPRYWKMPEDTNVVPQYSWTMQDDCHAYEFNTNLGVAYRGVIDDPEEGIPYGIWDAIKVGARTSGEAMYSGFSIGPVLNTETDYRRPELCQALLRIRYYNEGGPLALNLLGELTGIAGQESLERQNSHTILTSPTEYYTIPSDAFGYKPLNRDTAMGSWEFNTTLLPVVLPQTDFAPGSPFTWSTIDINVTAQYLELLSAVGINSSWELGNNMGWLFVGAGAGTSYIDVGSTRPRLWFSVTNPPYVTELVAAQWQDSSAFLPWPGQRKSSAMAHLNGNAVMFGGIDANEAMNDTWIHTWAGQFGGAWTAVVIPEELRPPARWGHKMCAGGTGILMFGGFDKDNQPLNDLWQFDGGTWSLLIPAEYAVPSRTPEAPPPRGGHLFGLGPGGWPVVFGGHDNNKYFNDTWVLEVPGGSVTVYDTNALIYVTNTFAETKWINIIPNGESANAPSPRAFMCHEEGKIRFFGGRTGVLPTGTDTDMDMVDDGMELDLGGPAEGRDPRVNALYQNTIQVVAPEKLPYSYLQFDPGYSILNAVQDFESLEYSIDHLIPSPEQLIYAGLEGLPIEGHEVGIIAGTYLTGFDGIMPEYTGQWWHCFNRSMGSANDARDVWDLGAPYLTSAREGAYPNSAPKQAYNGRWCYGTDLDDLYPNDAVMELYTPLFDLVLPNADSTDPANLNSYYLIFHEWLDLADANDMVRIEAVRPSTPADIVTRMTGSGAVIQPARPVVNIYPNRNNAYNTDGEWRRVIVPLDPIANESNLFFRFVLQTDDEGQAGGWFIDDVAIVQGGQIIGMYMDTGGVYLYGINGTNSVMNTLPGPFGDFGFSPLVSGEYRVLTGSGAGVDAGIFLGDGTWSPILNPIVNQDDFVLDITINSPVRLAWTAYPGISYRIEYATPTSLTTADPWTVLDTISPAGPDAVYIDMGSETSESRFYRVVMILQ